MRYKNLISLLIAGFLIAFVSNALATGDGRLLRRSLEDTCQGCHKTDKNAKFLPDGSVNPDSIKSHNSDWAGTCSNTSFLNRFDCEANNETWTAKWSAQGGWGKEGAKYGAIVCTTCHTTHSTRNIYLIRQVIKTPDNSNWASSGTPTVNVDFRYFSGSAGVTVGLMGDDTGGHTTSTRICEVCHSQTKYHRYNTTGQDSNDHQNANDCTVCHKHKKGFNPDFAASCGDCHGYPISTNEVTKGSSGLVVNDTQYVPNGETGRRTQFGNTAKGAHATHFNKSIGCGSCHYEGKAGAPPDPRFDSKIQIGFFLSGTTIGGTYKAPAFTNNTIYSIDPRGTTTYQADPARTCSNLYCHSDGGNYAGTFTYRTISWDTTLSTPTCDKCHGNQAGVYVTTDKHPQHINASTYNYKCYECHANTTDANNNIAGTGHVNKTKDVVWRTNSGAMNPDAGAYSRPNCSNNYCHSPGNKGSAPYDDPNTTAAWNGGSLDCSGCHGGDATKTNKVNTMAHLAHINDTANQVGWNIGCAECHAATVSSNTTLSSYTRHVDKRLQVKFDNSLNRNSDNPSYNGISSTGAGGAEKNAGAAGYTCSNVYCHSIGNLDSSGNVIAAGGSSFKSIGWNGSAINCSGCHGDSGSNKSHPIYASGSAGSTTANSHVKHVDDNSYGCDYCHLTTTTSSSLPPTSVIQAGAHLNRIENVAFKAVSGQTGSYNSGTKTCSSTYCHGSSNLVWGDAGATNCATCHDSQGAGGTALYTPKHTIHVDVAGYDYSCEMCHALGGTNHATGPASGTNPGGDPVGSNQTTEISFTSLSNAGWTTGNYRGSASSYKYRSMTNDPYTSNSISPTYADGASFATDSTNPGIKYTTNGTCNNIWCHSTATPGVNTYKSVAWNATLNCGSCHNQAGDASPVWTAPHTRHINTYTQYTCNYCHATVTSDNTTISSKTLHVNASKNVAFNTWTGGTWSGTQCSNTYCHSKGTTFVGPYSHSAISWSGTVGCGGCHGEGANNGSPSYTNGSPKANSHVKHVAGSGQTCDYCHANVVNASNTITSTALHVNQAYNVDMLTVGGRTGSYNAGAKTCSNTYCHGTPPSVAWGGTTNCASCHGANNNGDLSIGTTGGHALHYNIATLPTTMTDTDAHTSSAYAYACQNCHPTSSHSTGPVSGNQDAQISGTKMSVYTAGGTSYTDAKGFKYTYGTCTTVCHTRDGASGAPIVTAVWNGAKTTPNCGVCHNKAGDASPVWTAPHTKHINTYTQYTCSHCHATVAADNTTLAAGTTARQLHPNASKNVAFNTWTGGTWSGTQCSNTYCHSAGTSTSGTHASISWSGTVGCASCHLASTINTNAHQAHVNNVSKVGYQIGCAECHASTVSNNTTISSFTRHVDKLTNVKFDNVINPNSDNPTFNGTLTTGADGATRTVGGAATAACNNLYCHSNGNINGATPSFVSVAWNGSINCTGCHGDGSTKAHSTFANGGAGTATANSHAKHVEGSSQSCDYCHEGTTTDTNILPTTVVSGTRHLNRIEDVQFKLNGGKTGSYNSGTKTCSNTYCHGTPPSVAWGGTTNCASCHGANNNGDLSIGTTGGHALHYNIATLPTTMTDTDAHTSSAYAYACQNCHPTSSHSTGPVSGNQDAQISGTKMSAYTAGGTSYTDAKGFKYTYGTCTTVCHTRDGASGAPIVTAVWNGAKTTPNCGVCHNKAGDASPVWTAPHTKHINTYTQYTCSHCHATVAADNTTLAAGTTARQLHPNASKNVAFNTWTGGTWSGTQCSNTYCHSNGTSTSTGASPTHASISWSGTTTCNSCHTGPTTGPSYTNGTPKANSHAKHTGAPWNYLCNECHSSVVNSSNQIVSATLHANKAYTVNGANIGSYSPVTPPSTAGGTCSNVTCHGNNASAHQWGTTLKCSDCHMGASDADNWAHDGTLSKISSTQWSYSGHGKTTGTYDSTGNPAANFPGAAGTGDPCLYCHDGSAEHNITGTTNPIRLANLNWNGRGLNGNCMRCHETASPGYDPDGAGTVYALKNSTRKIDKYHYGTDHTATYSGGQWCWDCHDPHGDSSSTSGPLVMVHLRPAMKSDSLGRPTESTSVDVVFSARANGSDYGATASPFNKVCNVCHTQTTYYRNNLGANGHYTDVCTSCHSHSANTTYNGDAFSGAGGESAGGSACGTCHSAIHNRMNDSTANVVYKHYMNNANATYTVIAQPATLGGTSDTGRRCLTCHVDHNIFRPDINVNGARAKNLRLDISMTPTTTTGFTDTDFDATAANGGICLSCHFTQQSKALSTPNGAAVVPPIPYPGAGTIEQARDLIRNSTHNYAVASGTFKDSSSFKAVCLKCHDDTLTKQYQSSNPKFGLHQSGRNTLSAVMGSATFKDFVQGRVTAATTTTITTDQELTKDYTGYQVVVTKADGTLSQRRTIVSNTIEVNATITVASWAWTPSNNDFFEVVMNIVPVEDMCFSCHSQGSNSTGSGLDKPNAYKPTDGKDYYNTATMINKLEQIFNTFNADGGRIKTGISNQTSVTVCTNSTATANEFTGYIFRSGSVVKTVTTNTVTGGDSTCNTNYGLANSMTYYWSGGATLSAGAGYKVGKSSMHPLDTLGRHTPDEHLNAPSTRPTTISQAWNVGDTGGTASSASATSITAGTEKRWNTNTFTGLKIYFTSGSCAGQSSTITGNTATQINFSSFGCTPAAGDSYYIGKRHVSCTDCHNTHAAQPNPAGTVSSATNTPPSNITIKDSEKTTAKTGWAANKWKGYLIMVTKANGFRQIRQITTSTTDATGTTYQVGLAWNTSAVPAAGDRYEVFKLDGTTQPSGKGVWGVQIQFTAPTTKNAGENYAPSSTYTYTKVYDSPYQRDLCMKCHSYYGFLNSPPSNISGWGTINTIRPATDIAEEANPNNLGHHAIYDRGKNQPLTATGSTAKTGKYGFNPRWPKYTVGTVSIATNGLGTLFGTGALPQNILPGWMMYVGGTNFPAASSTTVPAGWYEIVEVLGSNSFRVTPGPSTALSNQTYGLTAGLGNTFIPPYGPWAILKCTDCHGSKLSDPAGPHASTNKFLIKEVERTIGYEFFTGTNVVVTTAFNSSAPNLNHFCHNCHSANAYGHQSQTSPPAAIYSRQSHAKIYSGDNRVSTATYVTTAISCHQCHAAYSRGSGGADQSERTGGIHGSNYYNKGTGNDNTNTFFTSAQGKRLLNGATWLNGPSGGGAQGVKRSTTTQVGTCYTRTTNTDAINRCNTGHNNQTDMGTAEYDYDNP